MDNAADVDVDRTVENKKTKRDKVRSAWISFAGRIVAQIVGAIATVALGVMVLHRYTATEARPPAIEASHDSRTRASAPDTPPAPIVIVLTPAMMGLRDANPPFWAADRPCAPRLEMVGGR